MITAIEITSRAPFVGGATFGTTGAYERLDGVAIGELDPAASRQPRHRQHRQGAAQRTRPRRGPQRHLHPAPGRSRARQWPHPLRGEQPRPHHAVCQFVRRPARQPAGERGGSGQCVAAEAGLHPGWSGWDPGAPRANGGLGLDAPVATDNGAPIVRRIREEFISGTRGGDLTQFRLSYEAATRDDARADRAAHADGGAAAGGIRVRRCPHGSARAGALPEPGSIYELHYNATKPRVLGIGFAATRDLVSHLRHARGRDLLGRQPTHALAFGISQAGRYLRDHLAQGFNRDESAHACSTACSPMSQALAACSSTPSSASRRARAPGTRTMISPRWNSRSPPARCCAATTAIRS